MDKRQSARQFIEERRRKGRAMVWVQDLEVLASMQCMHEAGGGKSCDETEVERGGCCNSCWAARWARSVLEEIGKWKSETQQS